MITTIKINGIEIAKYKTIAGWADARFLCKRCGKIKTVGKGNNTKLKICASCKRKKAAK